LDRFDSEYFYKDGLNNQYILERKNSQKFDIFGDFVASAFYPAATHLYEIGETPFIRVTDCINYPIITKEQDDVFEKIPRYFYNQNTSISTLKKGELVISKVGTPCFASLIDDYDEVALSRTVLGVKNIRNINSKYLLLFLRSKYGFEQLLRQRELTIQYQLTLQRVKNILIFVPSEIFQNKLADLVSLSHQKLQDHKTLYKQAEQLILQELDLLDHKPSKEKVAIKNLSESFGVSGRLDSEYYQPKYDEILEKIKSYKGGYEKLEYFSKSYSTGYPFKSDSYVDDGTYLIRINNIKKGYLDISNASKIPNDDKYLSLKDIANENDVLISMSGTIGNSCKIPQGISAVINQRIMKITPKNINFELLPLLINSIICQNQLERIGTGGVQTNISSSDILNIIIPTIDETIQSQIEQKIKKSFELKEQSKEFLDIAKKAVEIAIEEDEYIATEYINDQI
jgi:restriction endonuclease S subunit